MSHRWIVLEQYGIINQMTSIWDFYDADQILFQRISSERTYISSASLIHPLEFTIGQVADNEVNNDSFFCCNKNTTRSSQHRQVKRHGL